MNKVKFLIDNYIDKYLKSDYFLRVMALNLDKYKVSIDFTNTYLEELSDIHSITFLIKNINNNFPLEIKILSFDIDLNYFNFQNESIYENIQYNITSIPDKSKVNSYDCYHIKNYFLFLTQIPNYILNKIFIPAELSATEYISFIEHGGKARNSMNTVYANVNTEDEMENIEKVIKYLSSEYMYYNRDQVYVLDCSNLHSKYIEDLLDKIIDMNKVNKCIELALYQVVYGLDKYLDKKLDKIAEMFRFIHLHGEEYLGYDKEHKAVFMDEFNQMLIRCPIS